MAAKGFMALTTAMTAAVMHMQTVPSVGAAAEGDSSYSKDFGKYGDDPLQHGVDSANEMTRSGTTADLAAGTARPTMQRPGQPAYLCCYTLPASTPSLLLCTLLLHPPCLGHSSFHPSTLIVTSLILLTARFANALPTWAPHNALPQSLPCS